MTKHALAKQFLSRLYTKDPRALQKLHWLKACASAGDRQCSQCLAILRFVHRRDGHLVAAGADRADRGHGMPAYHRAGVGLPPPVRVHLTPAQKAHLAKVLHWAHARAVKSLPAHH